MSYPNKPQNNGDVDPIWEYPEDEWISMGEYYDMQMWTDENDGKLWITVYSVRNGRTQTLKPLATYRVLEDPFTWAEHNGVAEEFLELD